MKRLLLTLGFLLALASPALAQNTTCSDRPQGDVSNACANTRFVFNNSGSSVNCIVFTSIAKGCVPASGGGTINFLRADGTFAPTAGGGSAIVGMIIPWAGASVPPTYLLAYGQALSRSTYADLYSVITATQTITCTFGSPTITVTADNAARMTIGGVVESSACFAPGTTVVSKTATTITLITTAIANTSTTATLFPWGNGDGSTTFNIPNLMGRTLVGRDNMSGTAAGTLTSTYFSSNPDALGAYGGAQSTTLAQANLPNATLGLSAAFTGTPAAVNVTSTISNIDIGIGTPTTGGGGFAFNSVTSTGTVSSTGTFTPSGSVSGTTSSINGGVGQSAFSQVQPSVTIDYIIKVLPDSSVGDTITVGVTNVAGGSTTNILYNNAGKVGEYTLATAAEYLAGTANKIVQAGVLYQAEATTTYGTTTTFDFSTFINTAVTLTGDITTQTLTNVQAGKAGTITYIQDGGGGHTTVWNPIFKFTSGSAPALSTAGGAIDVLSYTCRSATFCVGSLIKDAR